MAMARSLANGSVRIESDSRLPALTPIICNRIIIAFELKDYGGFALEDG